MSLETGHANISLNEDGYFRAATEDPDGFA